MQKIGEESILKEIQSTKIKAFLGILHPVEEPRDKNSKRMKVR